MFFPIRVFAIIYIDLFRGLPSILIIYVLGFGIPALRLPGVSTDVFFWGVVSLVLVWSAYVAEVYRAGIDLVHPSQEAAARSLGLRGGFQAFQYVGQKTGGAAGHPAIAQRLHRATRRTPRWSRSWDRCRGLPAVPNRCRRVRSTTRRTS